VVLLLFTLVAAELEKYTLVQALEVTAVAEVVVGADTPVLLVQLILVEAGAEVASIHIVTVATVVVVWL
jgi:hypothetical protein